MKKKSLSIKKKKSILAIFVFFVISSLQISSAFCQADFYYDRNVEGLRIGAGVGASTLMTHFDKNPLNVVYMGSLEYDFSPYFSIGLEAQSGTLEGIDEFHKLYYDSSTDKYLSGTASVRVAPLGAIFSREEVYSAFEETIKRIYIGLGVGGIKTSNHLVRVTSNQATIYGPPVPHGKFLIIPFNIGTVIDLPGILGRDNISLNPNFQLNYVNTLFLDGFQSTQTSNLKGLFTVVSIKLKYKF